MKHRSISILFLFLLAVCGSTRATEIAPGMEGLLAKLSQLANGHAIVNYDSKLREIIVMGKEPILGNTRALNSSVAPQEVMTVIRIRVVPYMEKDKWAAEKKSRTEERIRHHRHALSLMPPEKKDPLDLRVFAPESEAQWKAYLDYVRAAEREATVPTHHWQGLGIVLNTDYVVHPVDPKNAQAKTFGEILAKVQALLTPYQDNNP